MLITLVLCVSLLLLFSNTAFAQTGVKLSASSESGAVGDTVTVEISVENATGTGGGEFVLTFDPDIVKPDSISRGTFVSDANNDQFMANLEYDDDKLMVMWVTPEEDTAASGVVCTIDFEVLDEGETSLTFSNVVIAPEEAEFDSSTAGSIEAEDPVDELQKAIDDANEAIDGLRDPDVLTLTDKPDVERARLLVNEAKDLGAVDADFDNLAKLERAETRIAKLDAIKTADDAILALPSVDALTLDDRPDVVAARALVDKAKADYGAVDGDFVYLSRLVAAENRIKELEGLLPTPPTGEMNYWLPAGMLFILVGLIAFVRRSRLASR